MKKTLAITIVTLSLAMSLGLAGPEYQVKVEVPFAFNIGENLYPAGLYIVEVSNSRSSVTLRDSKGEVLTRALSRPESSDRSLTGSKLVFHRYENQHFLAGIQNDGLAVALSRSRLEKQVAAHTSRTVRVHRAD